MNSYDIANNKAVAADDAKADALAEIAERMALALDGWSYEGNPDYEATAEFMVAPSENPDTPVTTGINRVEDEPGASFVVETGDGRRFTVLVLEEKVSESDWRCPRDGAVLDGDLDWPRYWCPTEQRYLHPSEVLYGDR